MGHFAILRPSGRYGLVLAVCIGLTVLPVTHAGSQPQQRVGAFLGAEAADRAYREIAAKNYAAAIKDFREALTANPSNARWRKDLGYACLAAGLPEQAVAEFTRVYAEHPEDFAVELQLGYLAQQLKHYEDARKYFGQVAQSADSNLSTPARKALAELQATELSDRRQKGYELLLQHRSGEAITVFEAIHRDDPSDMKVTLQLGYLYAAAGRTGEAKEMFIAAEKSADPKVVAQAKAGLEQIRLETKLWFATIYAAPFYQTRFSNEINPVAAKVGLKLSPYFEPYVGLRFSRDVRSLAGTLPQIFSDNSAVISIGVQSVLAHTGVVVYAEAGTAINLIGEKPLAASDYRAGAVWFRSWGTGLNAARTGEQPVSLTGSVYADGGFYSRYQHNVIANLQLREGINLPGPRVLPIQLLAGTNIVKDSNGNFYNNVFEVGPILRIAPLRRLTSLSFETQYLRGFYFVHDPANPYHPRYDDLRLFLIWSKTF
ncbi:MAG: tetratricopeptide repeat protein [Candidatus Acidiferrum sp.]